MPHKSGYGNDKKMPMKKGKKYSDSYGGGDMSYDSDFDGGMPVTQSEESYFRPMDSYPMGKNPHEY